MGLIFYELVQFISADVRGATVVQKGLMLSTLLCSDGFALLICGLQAAELPTRLIANSFLFFPALSSEQEELMHTEKRWSTLLVSVDHLLIFQENVLVLINCTALCTNSAWEPSCSSLAYFQCDAASHWCSESVSWNKNDCHRFAWEILEACRRFKQCQLWMPCFNLCAGRQFPISATIFRTTKPRGRGNKCTAHFYERQMRTKGCGHSPMQGWRVFFPLKKICLTRSKSSSSISKNWLKHSCWRVQADITRKKKSKAIFLPAFHSAVFAQGSGGVIIPEGFQQTWKCGTEGHGLARRVVMSSWQDYMILEIIISQP